MTPLPQKNAARDFPDCFLIATEVQLMIDESAIL